MTQSEIRLPVPVVTTQSWWKKIKPRLGDPIAYVMIAPAIILLAVFFYYPVFQSFYMSLFNWPLLGERTFIGLGNYLEMFTDKVAIKAWTFTVIWTLVITPMIFVVAFLLAFLTSSQRKLMGIFRSIYFVPTILMTVASGVIWRYFFGSQAYGLANYALMSLKITSQPLNFLGSTPQSIFSVAFSGIWMWVGLTMLLLVGAIQSIPLEIHESANMDGATWLQTTWYITLPLMRTTFGMAMIISIIGSFLSFAEFLIMTQGGPNHSTTPILMWIYNTSFQYYHLGYGAALSFVLMLVLIVLTTIQMKLFHRPEEF
jgi:multiple sugar transport system permease protein